MGPIYALILAVLFRLESATLRRVLGMTISRLVVILRQPRPPQQFLKPRITSQWIVTD